MEIVALQRTDGVLGLDCIMSDGKEIGWKLDSIAVETTPAADAATSSKIDQKIFQQDMNFDSSK